MMRWTLIVVGGLVLIVALVVIIGWMWPPGHHAERRVVLTATPEQVFGVITDVAQAASWRSDVKRVEAVAGAGVGMTFREVGSNGTVPFRVDLFEPGRRLVTRIDTRTLPFGGTALTIAEDGEIYNPIFRFMSRFLISQAASIERYQADLATRLR
jgi:hypothetical protein